MKLKNDFTGFICLRLFLEEQHFDISALEKAEVRMMGKPEMLGFGIDWKEGDKTLYWFADASFLFYFSKLSLPHWAKEGVGTPDELVFGVDEVIRQHLQGDNEEPWWANYWPTW